MQLQLFQLTCKLPIWTERERKREYENTKNRFYKSQGCLARSNSRFPHKAIFIYEDVDL